MTNQTFINGIRDRLIDSDRIAYCHTANPNFYNSGQYPRPGQSDPEASCKPQCYDAIMS